jgi:protein-S-isoprenylcysteine O-methyltransferase Ste14
MEQKRRIVPPVYLLITLVVMAALHLGAPIMRIFAPPYSYGGAVLLILGIAVSGISAGAFAKAGTPVVPFERSTVLVVGGFYRYTRNPMYLGMVTALLGVAMLFGTLSAFLPIPIFVWIIQKHFIEGEERFLEEIFGEQYLAYKGKVRRWL